MHDQPLLVTAERNKRSSRVRALPERAENKAQRATAFGTPAFYPCALDDLLARSDFVVLACPLTPQTKHLINERTLGLIKHTSWLINIGRGAVVQETALIEALRNKRIAGAMLDVYEYYRLEPGHALFSVDNVILTPHLAAVTKESRARASVAAADEMLRILRGERPRNLVNPEVLRKEVT